MTTKKKTTRPRKKPMSSGEMKWSRRRKPLKKIEDDAMHRIVLDRIRHGLCMYEKRASMKLHIEQEITHAEIPMSLWNDLVDQAKLELRIEIAGNIEDSRGTAIEFYKTIIASPASTIEEKLKAQARIDVILGHDARLGAQESTEQIAAKLREFIAHIFSTTTVPSDEAET